MKNITVNSTYILNKKVNASTAYKKRNTLLLLTTFQRMIAEHIENCDGHTSIFEHKCIYSLYFNLPPYSKLQKPTIEEPKHSIVLSKLEDNTLYIKTNRLNQ